MRSTRLRSASSASWSWALGLGQLMARPGEALSCSRRPIARYTVNPLGWRWWRRSTIPFSWSRAICSRLASRAHFDSENRAVASQAAPNCCSTSIFFALLEWSSKQNSPNPTSRKRRYTTSKAAIFSEMNSTLRPSARLWAIMFEIVWDLPVPGGPMRTKSLPLEQARIDDSCDESAASGV